MMAAAVSIAAGSRWLEPLVAENSKGPEAGGAGLIAGEARGWKEKG